MYSRRPKPNQAEEAEARSEYWMTFSDLMAGLLMVFALILSVTVLVATQKHKHDVETIESQRRDIEKQQKDIEARKQVVEEQKKDIEARKQVAERRLGIRQQIIDDLRRRLAGYDVEVDRQTGTLMIAAAVLFDQNDATVKPAGKDVLDAVMQAYAEVLLDNERYREHLSRIIVEGHTNDDGTYIYNLKLSQRRAFNVMVHILDHFSGGPYRESLKKYLVASGRSKMDLVMSNGVVDKELSRRILVKFGLRDEHVIEELRQIFESPL